MMKIVALALAATLSAVEATKAQQELRIGLMNAEPGVIQQGKQTTGRDIDIWDAIAKDTGLRVTYVLLSSPQAVLTALDEGKVDVAGWTSTTSAKYLLSVTILPTAEALVVPKADAREYRGVHDIKAMTVATLGRRRTRII
jgi:ABC-type amino acid transport substrate-binding protein